MGPGERVIPVVLPLGVGVLFNHGLSDRDEMSNSFWGIFWLPVGEALAALAYSTFSGAFGDIMLADLLVS